jgi:hypothetical protein
MFEDGTLWEKCYIAALSGSAREALAGDKDEQYVINRAYRIADAATRSILARREYAEREKQERSQKPRMFPSDLPPPPVENRAPFGVKALNRKKP